MAPSKEVTCFLYAVSQTWRRPRRSRVSCTPTPKHGAVQGGHVFPVCRLTNIAPSKEVTCSLYADSQTWRRPRRSRVSCTPTHKHGAVQEGHVFPVRRLTSMASSKRCHAISGKSEEAKKTTKSDINTKAHLVIENRKRANDIFDVFEYLQAEKERDVVCAVGACSQIFCKLLNRGDLFVGLLPEEDSLLAGKHQASEKYGIFMRHRYNDCVKLLLELMAHEKHQVKESALCALMKFVSEEGQRPLVDSDCHYNFPRELLKAVVCGLLAEKEDMTLLISRFQEFLEMDDVRYYVMGLVSDSVGRVMERAKGAILPVYQNNVFALLSNINMPGQESELTNFLIQKNGNQADWKPAKLKDHKRAFERMWLAFLKYKLPSNMYKKILVILHESILPNFSQPTLMIDFLTSAYDIGGAISLLALNGLFVLIHQHNLDYPDFYKKLYSLLEPSVFHVRYRARFFHLADLFLSSSHLPVYLVAAFVKRLSRLALTAPPAALLMILPFIYNLIRRHPACRVLIHRPNAPDVPCDDPYLMEEEDPALCRALDSSLWELQTLQKHYHPDVSKAAMMISRPLSEQEDDVSKLLELSTYELFEQDLQWLQKHPVALEFEVLTQLLEGSGNLLGGFFSLE